MKTQSGLVTDPLRYSGPALWEAWSQWAGGEPGEIVFDGANESLKPLVHLARYNPVTGPGDWGEARGGAVLLPDSLLNVLYSAGHISIV